MNLTLPISDIKPIRHRGNSMGRTGGKREPPKQDEKPKKPQKPPVENDDDEDGEGLEDTARRFGR